MLLPLSRVLAFCSMFLVAPCFCAQEISKRSELRVQYSAFDKSYESRMVVRFPPGSSSELPTGKKDRSPQGTRWQIAVLPDTMKPGPWTTHVYLGSGANPEIELVFVDETNGGVGIKWLNEKLLYGQVWWGRIHSTDFIFDVEQRKFVYREMAHYRELIEPCKE